MEYVEEEDQGSQEEYGAEKEEKHEANEHLERQRHENKVFHVLHQHSRRRGPREVSSQLRFI